MASKRHPLIAIVDIAARWARGIGFVLLLLAIIELVFVHHDPSAFFTASLCLLVPSLTWLAFRLPGNPDIDGRVYEEEDYPAGGQKLGHAGIASEVITSEPEIQSNEKTLPFAELKMHITSLESHVDINGAKNAAEVLRALLERQVAMKITSQNIRVVVAVRSVGLGSIDVIYDFMLKFVGPVSAVLIAYPSTKKGYEDLVKDLRRDWQKRYAPSLGRIFRLSEATPQTLRLETEDEIKKRLAMNSSQL